MNVAFDLPFHPIILMDIFTIKPIQWGLRGDPELWNRLHSACEGLDASTSPDEFGKILDAAFDKLTQSGRRISEKIIWFEDFPQSGMSGGSISLPFWHETGLPLLKKSYKDKYEEIV